MRVLIADDDSSTRHLLWRLFTEWGHTVLLAADGDEAWSVLAEDNPPGMVILDRALSNGGGLSLCRLLREFSTRASMHVILSTAVTDKALLVSAFEAGADDLICKPFDIEDLRQRVAKLEKDERQDRAVRERAALAPGTDRQLALLADLARRALGAASLDELARVVTTELGHALAADRVEVWEEEHDRVPSLRASFQPARGARGASTQPTVTVAIGPDARPFGKLVVGLVAPRQVQPFEMDILHTVAALIGGAAERERLHAQLQQAQKMETFGQLAGGVAHDFNNVLAAVGTSASTLEMHLPPDPELREDVDLIARAVERGRQLAHRLLDFSRTPGDEPCLLDLNQVVDEASAMLERVLMGRVGLRLALSTRALAVCGDRGDLEQVLVNLVLNARDALPAGGTIEVESHHVPGREPDAGFVAFTVIDHGAGMDEATKTRMFEPFFTTKPPGQGTGLGLSTVRQIIRRLEGKITVDSAPGRGTKITVFFPCADSCCRNGHVDTLTAA